MTNKERYIEWVGQQEFVPISMNPWWLDAVCAGKEWDVLLAEDAQGNISGAMPYLLRRKAWYKYIVMPPLSQTGGVWVTADITADRWKTAEVCRQIKEQLDNLHLAYYYQNYLPGSLCVDAMCAMGFKAREHQTLRIDDLSNLDTLIASFSKSVRRQLQKALSLHAEHTMDPEDFYRFHTRCMAVRGRKPSYSREFLLVIERKAHRLKQCEILSICNADGQVYAAAFLIWDKSYMYFLIPVLDPAFKESGASALLALEAMKLAREKKVHFDFEGLADKRLTKVYQQFHPTPVKYFSVERSYQPIRAFFIRCAQHFT